LVKKRRRKEEKTSFLGGNFLEGWGKKGDTIQERVVSWEGWWGLSKRGKITASRVEK